MKILHIISGLENGGAEAILYRILAEDKHNTHVIISLLDSGYYGSLFNKLGINVYLLNISNDKLKINSFLKLYRLIVDISPSIIQTWMYHANLFGGLAAFFARKKVIWGIHSSDLTLSKGTLSTYAVNRFCQLLSRTIPRDIVYCSEYAAKVHMDFGYSKVKASVIHNGVDTNWFKPDSEKRRKLRSEWLLNENDIIFGMVARWDKNKDHLNLIQALSSIKSRIKRPWKCVLFGRSINNSNLILVELLKKYNLLDNFMLLGLSDDIPAIMNAIDLHILSSSSEAFGNTTIEAMSCGTPAIVTAVGAGELIVGNVGWSVPPSAPNILGERIFKTVNLMEDNVKWDSLQLSCRARIIENFSAKKMIESYRDIWGQYE